MLDVRLFETAAGRRPVRASSTISRAASRARPRRRRLGGTARPSDPGLGEGDQGAAEPRTARDPDRRLPDVLLRGGRRHVAPPRLQEAGPGCGHRSGA